MNLAGIEQNTILFDSMSKRYSECGIRIGAIITRNKAVLEAALKFGMARLCPPALGQIAAEASLDTSEEYFTSVYQEYIQRRNYMVETLNEMPGVVCPMPKGAFLFYCPVTLMMRKIFPRLSGRIQLRRRNRYVGTGKRILPFPRSG